MTTFKVWDREYEFPTPESISVKEEKLLNRHAEMEAMEVFQRLQKGSVTALCAVVYLAKRRAGEAILWKHLEDLTWDDVEPPVDDTDDEDAEDEEELEGEGKPQAPPTTSSKPPSAGKTQKNGSQSTSARSRTSSGSAPAK